MAFQTNGARRRQRECESDLAALEFYAGNVERCAELFKQVELQSKEDSDIHLERAALKWQSMLVILLQGECKKAAHFLEAARAVDAVTSSLSAAGLDHALDICQALAKFVVDRNPASVAELGHSVFATDSRIHTHPALEWQDTTELLMLMFILVQACLAVPNDANEASMKVRSSLMHSLRQAHAMLTEWVQRFRFARPMQLLFDCCVNWLEMMDISTSWTVERVQKLFVCITSLDTAIESLVTAKFEFFLLWAQVWQAHQCVVLNRQLNMHQAFHQVAQNANAQQVASMKRIAKHVGDRVNQAVFRAQQYLTRFSISLDHPLYSFAIPRSHRTLL